MDDNYQVFFLPILAQFAWLAELVQMAQFSNYFKLQIETFLLYEMKLQVGLKNITMHSYMSVRLVDY